MSSSTLQQFAGHYIRNLHWTVVPLVGKACFDDDWQQRTYDVRHFTGSGNIGIRSTNGLVVVDDDFPTSEVACANAFLPSTGAIYGRPTKLRAKRLYHCPKLTQTVKDRVQPRLRDVQSHSMEQRNMVILRCFGKIGVLARLLRLSNNAIEFAESDDPSATTDHRLDSSAPQVMQSRPGQSAARHATFQLFENALSALGSACRRVPSPP